MQICTWISHDFTDQFARFLVIVKLVSFLESDQVSHFISWANSYDIALSQYVCIYIHYVGIVLGRISNYNNSYV